MRICFIIINTRSLWKPLCHKSCSISYNFIFLILFSHKYPFVRPSGVWTTGPKTSRFASEFNFVWIASLSFWPIIYALTFFDRFRLKILIFINDIKWYIIWKKILSIIISFQFHLFFIETTYRDLLIFTVFRYLNLFWGFMISYVYLLIFFLNNAILIISSFSFWRIFIFWTSRYTMLMACHRLICYNF